MKKKRKIHKKIYISGIVIGILLVIYPFIDFGLSYKDASIPDFAYETTTVGIARFIDGYIAETPSGQYAFSSVISDAKNLNNCIELNKSYFDDLSEYYDSNLGFYKVNAEDKLLVITSKYMQANEWTPTDFYVRQKDDTFVNAENGSKLMLPSGKYFSSKSTKKDTTASLLLEYLFKQVYLYLGILIIAFCIWKYIKSHRLVKYLAIINDNNEVSIDELMRIGKTTFDRVEKDINSMLKSGYIEGYLDTEKRRLIISTPIITNNIPKEKRVFNVKPCPTCGATNSPEAYQKGKCEYCGSPLSN